MYILALIISSLCVAKQYERSITERETESRRRERLIPVNTPAALQINTIKNNFPFPKHDSECTNLLLFSIQIDNFSSKSFKYSTKSTMNMEWRCKPGLKIHHLLTCSAARSF